MNTMNRRHIVIDPIHGNIEMPRWLVRIKDELPIRRMMNIRQLGLKAYVDFPGAIHTRYLHSLGTMHLAGKLADLLIKKEETKGRIDLKENIINNKNSLMAAGFLHDIGHGPFSHVLDFVLRKALKTTHEAITTEIIEKNFRSALEGDSIPVDHVCRIIKDEHEYPFLGDIINGPLDIDKVDYIIRDGYFVGLKYGFDLDHFLNQITVLGQGDDLKKCELGLERTPEARVSAEIFLLIWKSLYDLVYHIKSSRIAEKMLEKAIFVALNESKDFRKEMKSIDKYIALDEASLLYRLSEIDSFSQRIVDSIKKNELYTQVFEATLEKFRVNSEFLQSLGFDHDDVSDVISQELSKAESTHYCLICDIIRTKVPKVIHIDQLDKEGEPLEIKSKVIEALAKEEVLFRVYASPNFVKKKKGRVKEEGIKAKIQQIIERWKL